jgi:general secretion pathway protein B
MSFILDALKKSESERQRKGTPGIADVPQGTANPGGRRWAWIIGALLAVNLSVLLVLILRPDTKEPRPGTELSVKLPGTGAPAATPVPPFSEIVSDAKRDQSTIPVSEPVKQSQPTAKEAPVTPAPAPAPAHATARVVDGPPTFNELRADGSLQLPDLHLDIHVYSPTPAERFVFINMSRYKENATLDEGPRVAEITPEGVILEYTGMRFLLPRE